MNHEAESKKFKIVSGFFTFLWACFLMIPFAWAEDPNYQNQVHQNLTDAQAHAEQARNDANNALQNFQNMSGNIDNSVHQAVASSRPALGSERENAQFNQTHAAMDNNEAQAAFDQAMNDARGSVFTQMAAQDSQNAYLDKTRNAVDAQAKLDAAIADHGDVDAATAARDAAMQEMLAAQLGYNMKLDEVAVNNPSVQEAKDRLKAPPRT